MRQGTTPIYTFTFPFDLSVADDILVTFKQGSRLISKHKEDGTTEGDTFAFRLTQEETLGFYEGNCKGQIKLLNGIDVIGSTLFDVKVKPILERTPFNVSEVEEDENSTHILTLSHSLSNCEVAIDELNQDIVVEFSEAYTIGGGAGEVKWEDIKNKPSKFASSSDIVANDDSDYEYIEGATVAEALAEIDSSLASIEHTAETALAGIRTHASNEEIHTTAEKKAEWDAKYSKPANGIPKSDLTASVQASLDKADSSVQSLEGYATEDFVNSSIATQTAHFIGTFQSVAELNAYSGTKTPNDYAFVIVYDSVVPTQVKQYDRYKWTGTAWTFEYTLNNSSFTQAQWSAINSGITNAKRQQYDGYALTKQDTIDDLDDMRTDIAENHDNITLLGEAFENGVSVLTDAIDGKVDKVDGMGLSSNDFTTAYKNKVDSNTLYAHTHSNKATLDAIEGTEEADAVDVDTAVTSGSNHLITSGAVYNYILSLNANEVMY